MKSKFKIFIFLIVIGSILFIYKTKYLADNKIFSSFSTDAKVTNSDSNKFNPPEGGANKNSAPDKLDLDGEINAKSTSELKEFSDLDFIKKSVANKSLDTLIMKKKHTEEVTLSFKAFKRNQLNLSSLVNELSELNKVSYLKSDKSLEYQSLYNQKLEKIYKQYEIYLRSQDDLRNSLEKELESFISSHQI